MNEDRKVSVLDENGRFLREAYPDYEPMPQYYTLDMPGNMPGPGAVYVDGTENKGKFSGGRWEYDPPLPVVDFPYP